MRDIEVHIAAAAARENVSFRLLAESVGRIMATHIAVGDVARHKTQFLYRFIVDGIGVLLDATQRKLKVAWDRRGTIPLDVVKELQLWRDLLPGHAGTPIREGPDAPCTISMGADSSDTHWAGLAEAEDGKW